MAAGLAATDPLLLVTEASNAPFLVALSRMPYVISPAMGLVGCYGYVEAWTATGD